MQKDSRIVAQGKIRDNCEGSQCSLQHSHSFYQGQLGIARSLAMTVPVLAVSHALVTKQS
eukprot:scaffold7346_cov94-Skeletonema_dohrnii-CCMP3373.AAC.3